MKKLLFVLEIALFLMIGCEDKSTEPDNEAPVIPYNPVPADSSLNVSVNTILYWSCSDPDGDALVYDVYFGTTTDSFLVSTGQSDSTYIAGVMNYETTYYWKIVASDGEDETISPVWTFTTESEEIENQPPAVPSNPVPADSSMNVSVNAGLSWSCSDPDGDVLSYDIYFGTTTDSFLVSTSQSDSTYVAGVMNYETTYYWKIVADDGEYEIEGEIWSFTTEAEGTINHPPDAPFDPVPNDNAENVSVNSNISWSGSDPDGDALTYDVYFGNTTNPPSVIAGQSNTSYDLGPLDFGSIYYWKIIADDGELETEGEVWCFTTIEEEQIEGMILEEGGTFDMGDHFNEGFYWELPVHEVTVNSFLIGQYEVTHTNYIEFLNSWGVSSNGSYNGVELIDMYDSYCAIDYNGSFYFGGSGKAPNIECPVIEVTWYGCIVYCNWLSEQEGLTPCYDLSDWCCDFSADGYRLPTEAEWEYAARGGLNWTDNYRYSGTTDNIGDYAWYFFNSGYQTHAVGTKLPNQLDIYDMTGNVYEWCNDWWFYGYYGSSPVNNPTGPVSGSARVVRGGHFYGNEYDCRVAFRSFSFPFNPDFIIGFRILRAYPY